MGPNILAIDDSEIALDLISVSLADLGFSNVSTVQKPREALDQLVAGTLAPDIVLLDVMMPDIDGVEMCARIRVNPATSEVPIIMLSSQTDTETLNMAFMAGANDYITKPFERIELDARIKNCLRLKSELDRRKSSEARLASSIKTAGLSVRAEDEIDQDFLLGPAAFDAVIEAIPKERWPDLGLIAMGILRNPATKVRGSVNVPTAIAAALGRVEIPSRAIFVPYGSGLFFCAALGLPEAELEALALTFKRTFQSAGFKDRDDPASGPLVMTTHVTRPTTDMSIATTVAEAIRAVQGARHDT